MSSDDLTLLVEELKTCLKDEEKVVGVRITTSNYVYVDHVEKRRTKHNELVDKRKSTQVNLGDVYLVKDKTREAYYWWERPNSTLITQAPLIYYSCDDVILSKIIKATQQALPEYDIIYLQPAEGLVSGEKYAYSEDEVLNEQVI
jgi:hypothetical protein